MFSLAFRDGRTAGAVYAPSLIPKIADDLWAPQGPARKELPTRQRSVSDGIPRMPASWGQATYQSYHASKMPASWVQATYQSLKVRKSSKRAARPPSSRKGVTYGRLRTS